MIRIRLRPAALPRVPGMPGRARTAARRMLNAPPTSEAAEVHGAAGGGGATRPGSIVQTEQTVQRPGKASKEKGSHRGKRLSRGRKVSKRPPCRGDPDTKTTLFGFLNSGRKRTLLNKN